MNFCVFLEKYISCNIYVAGFGKEQRRKIANPFSETWRAIRYSSKRVKWLRTIVSCCNLAFIRIPTNLKNSPGLQGAAATGLSPALYPG